MNEEKVLVPERVAASTEPEIVVNEYGVTRDDAVVVEEADRTVLMTGKETIVIEKQPGIDIVPANRPRKVYKGMWGTTEIAAFGVSLLTVLCVIALYLFYVVPSNNELELARAERDKLERERADAQSKYGNITSTQEQVTRLVTSVDDFETRYLPVASNGRTALYQRLNSLIVGYGLVNTSGPDFAPLDTVDGTEAATDETGRARYRSFFPGVYVTMTVEGSYSNIRRFIREIETGNEFVLISSVELEPSDSTNNRERAPAAPSAPADSFDPTRGFPPSAVQPGEIRRPRGRTLGEVVSLRLEMAAYFKRANMAEPAATEPAN